MEDSHPQRAVMKGTLEEGPHWLCRESQDPPTLFRSIGPICTSRYWRRRGIMHPKSNRNQAIPTSIIYRPGNHSPPRPKINFELISELFSGQRVWRSIPLKICHDNGNSASRLRPKIAFPATALASLQSLLQWNPMLPNHPPSHDGYRFQNVFGVSQYIRSGEGQVTSNLDEEWFEEQFGWRLGTGSTSLLKTLLIWSILWMKPSSQNVRSSIEDSAELVCKHLVER